MRFTRRFFVAGALASPFVTGRAASASEDTPGPVRNNISAFRTHEWQDHFDALGVGIIISDTTAKVLQHWTSDGQMYLYPTSVPLSDELTRRGYTEVVEKRVNPSWAPTPSMRERNPEWPAFVPGGDPTNPLGTRALYLSWQYYRIHGTHDTPKTDALMGTSSPWNRGRLLVEGAAHCAACHTGRTLAGGLDDSARFAGNDSLPGGSKAPSILTADLLERGWTVANMAYALQTGLLPNGDVFGGSMAEVVAEGTSYLTDADREAIATYLLDPAGSGDIPEPAPPVTETPMAGMDHSQMEMGNEN